MAGKQRISTFQATTHLVKAVMGAGSFALPWAFIQAGAALGPLLLIFTAILSAYTHVHPLPGRNKGGPQAQLQQKGRFGGNSAIRVGKQQLTRPGPRYRCCLRVAGGGYLCRQATPRWNPGEEWGRCLRPRSSTTAQHSHPAPRCSNTHPSSSINYTMVLSFCMPSRTTPLQLTCSPTPRSQLRPSASLAGMQSAPARSARASGCARRTLCS
eukprot:1536315-Rhodomonas_salina.1